MVVGQAARHRAGGFHDGPVAEVAGGGFVGGAVRDGKLADFVRGEDRRGQTNSEMQVLPEAQEREHRPVRNIELGDPVPNSFD